MLTHLHARAAPNTILRIVRNRFVLKTPASFTLATTWLPSSAHSLPAASAAAPKHVALSRHDRNLTSSQRDLVRRGSNSVYPLFFLAFAPFGVDHIHRFLDDFFYRMSLFRVFSLQTTSPDATVVGRVTGVTIAAWR